jgi:hypothetical protein
MKGTYCKVDVLANILRQMILVTCDTVASRKVVFVVVILRVEQLLCLGYCRIELDPIATYFVRLNIPNAELFGRFYVRAVRGKISQTTWNVNVRAMHKRNLEY